MADKNSFPHSYRIQNGENEKYWNDFHETWGTEEESSLYASALHADLESARIAHLVDRSVKTYIVPCL